MDITIGDDAFYCGAYCAHQAGVGGVSDRA
jgi:hypothetical protein